MGAISRRVGRVLPVSEDDRVLLLFGCDPAVPEVRYWFTIGGAVDPGETHAGAAARELREETGIEVPESALGPAFGTDEFEFSWNGARYRNVAELFAVRVPRTEVTFAGLDELESQSIFEARWWAPDELVADGSFDHPRLIDQMRAAIAHVGRVPS